MVVITTEVLYICLRVFKWNEKLPATIDKRALFLVRVYEERLTVSPNENGDGINKSRDSVMYPYLKPVPLSSLRSPCRINQLLDLYVLTPEVVFQDYVKSLNKSIAADVFAYFRFKNKTLRGIGPKPVFVVQIYRHKTIDHTKEGVLDVEEPVFCETLVNFAGQRSSSDILLDDGIGFYQRLDYVRTMRRHFGIRKYTLLEQIESDEPKGLHEVKTLVSFQKFKVCDRPESDEYCPICIKGFCEGVKIVETPCAHRFHRDCIFQWLSINISCPMCRSECVVWI